eukprot:TRINITY_DN15858_c0_g1_i1.p1 TRINITY_DN15858_c0_g1~~TRINITY_DN15858_c0_g1_i1.p1  ORF type:complete len:588 (+),score=99.67 TRINITY_DN15858_c0_g1_i1:60-1823(+)
MDFRLRYLCVLILFAAVIFSDERNHRYEDGETVKLWVNKVGPYFNPQETYKYFSLPFCKAKNKLETRREGLGEALEGNELVDSGYEIFFKVNAEKKKDCERILSENDVDAFTKAVKNYYWFEMYIDDLPMWGMIGELRIDADSKMENVYVYTHHEIVVAYNKDRIIEVNITMTDPVKPIAGQPLPSTYSVSWAKVSIPFSDRFDKYLDDTFFEHQIHWFSIINSFMIVIFLVSVVVLIMTKTLKKDFAKYEMQDLESSAIENEYDVSDDSGWKQVHNDVFRPPAYLTFFCAIIGTGYQLTCLVFLLIFVSGVGTLYRGRGSITTAFIVCYALTSFVGGYASGSLYMRCKGKSWVKNLCVVASLFPGLCFLVGLFLNIISSYYHSLATIPFGTIVAIMLIWIVIAFPLTVGGTIIGRKFAERRPLMFRINQVPRPIPDKKWYMEPLCMILFGGMLPFGSVYVEMYYIFTSFWNYKFYYVYGFMLLIYVILIIVSACSSIVTTYFLLNSEDYRWPWISFLSSGSVALYVWFYSIIFFMKHTNMSGAFQTCFYFAYVLLFCIGFGALTGTIGYVSSSLFVRRIYQNIKAD